MFNHPTPPYLHRENLRAEFSAHKAAAGEAARERDTALRAAAEGGEALAARVAALSGALASAEAAGARREAAAAEALAAAEARGSELRAKLAAAEAAWAEEVCVPRRFSPRKSAKTALPRFPFRLRFPPRPP